MKIAAVLIGFAAYSTEVAAADANALLAFSVDAK